jgi:hypothetical protein
MDADLARLVRAGRITRALAEQRASVPEELNRLLGGEAAVMPTVGRAAEEAATIAQATAPPPPVYTPGA